MTSLPLNWPRFDRIMRARSLPVATQRETLFITGLMARFTSLEHVLSALQLESTGVMFLFEENRSRFASGTAVGECVLV